MLILETKNQILVLPSNQSVWQQPLVTLVAFVEIAGKMTLPKFTSVRC